MSDATAITQEPWDDEWTDGSSSTSNSIPRMEFEVALERQRAVIAIALDRIIDGMQMLHKNVSERTGVDYSDLVRARLFSQLQDRLIEIGRHVFMSPYPGPGLDPLPARIPSTEEEISGVLDEASALFERAYDKWKGPDPATQGPPEP